MKATRSSKTPLNTYSNPSASGLRVLSYKNAKINSRFKIYEQLLFHTIAFLSQSLHCFRRLLSTVVDSRIISNAQILILMTPHLQQFLLLKYVVKLRLCHVEIYNKYST
jgi:hypothetical protein